METEKPILAILAGSPVRRAPLWLMRQAGRYLPEYKTLRNQAKSFLDLCLTPQLATEITLQPIRRFDLDAAIIFADILLIPYALGQKLEFHEGKGPVLEPLKDKKSIDVLNLNLKKISPIMETLDIVKGKLPKETTLIGFCGAPWTVAAYMIDGAGKTGFQQARLWTRDMPELLDRLTAILVDASEKYLGAQIEAGAEVIQIFESWAGLLSGAKFDRWVIKPTRELVSRLKKAHPYVPVIGFPREAGDKYRDYADKTNIDALGIDQHVSLKYAREKLQPVKPLQGNLDPLVLVKGGEEMKTAARAILDTFGPRHIFNLGHGVLPETPPAHVAELAKFVHAHGAGKG
jgi:uroporphyrinogen decarboxylase